MNRTTAALFGVLCLCSSALGGTVEFSVAEFDINEPAPVLLEVTVVGDSAYDFADIFFYSNDVPITGIVFSDEWLAAFSFVAEPVWNPFGMFPYEFFTSATNASPVGPVLYMGRIVADPTSLGLTEQDVGTQLQIIVDDPLPWISEPEKEEFYGKGTINVVPEPATLILLGLGSLGLARRRRAARCPCRKGFRLLHSAVQRAPRASQRKSK